MQKDKFYDIYKCLNRENVIRTWDTLKDKPRPRPRPSIVNFFKADIALIYFNKALNDMINSLDNKGIKND